MSWGTFVHNINLPATDPACLPYTCSAFDEWSELYGEDPDAEYVTTATLSTTSATVPATFGGWEVVGDVGTPWSGSWQRTLANEPLFPSAVACQVNGTETPLVLAARNTFGSARLVRNGTSVAATIRILDGTGNGDAGTFAVSNTNGQMDINVNAMRIIAQGAVVDSVALPADFSHQGKWLYATFSTSERFQFISGNTWHRFVTINATLSDGGTTLASSSGEYQLSNVGGGAFPRPDLYLWLLPSTGRMDIMDILTGSYEQIVDGETYYKRKFEDYVRPAYCELPT